MRSYSSHLDIASVSYTDQGSFTCLAITNIAGRRKELSSQEVELTVQGPPQVLRQMMLMTMMTMMMMMMIR